MYRLEFNINRLCIFNSNFNVEVQCNFQGVNNIDFIKDNNWFDKNYTNKCYLFLLMINNFMAKFRNEC